MWQKQMMYLHKYEFLVRTCQLINVGGRDGIRHAKAYQVLEGRGDDER